MACYRVRLEKGGREQVEFALYEHEDSQKLRYLFEKGYSKEKKLWSRKFYDYYSKYLPIDQLRNDQYDAQEEEIMDFVRKCLADRFNKNDDAYLWVPEKDLFYEARIMDLEDPARVKVEITDKEWKKNEELFTDVSRLVRVDEADTFLELPKVKSQKTAKRPEQKPPRSRR